MKTVQGAFITIDEEDYQPDEHERFNSYSFKYPFIIKNKRK